MKLLLLAGEESGVLYADRIRAEFLKTHPDAEIRGYGDYGFRTEDLGVMGFGPILRKIFYFLRVKRTMERAIDEWKPEVVCTVDYPGMNLKLAAYAKCRGIRAVHVVCPQVWAWKQGRIPKIEASLDKLCCFFPFEPKLFKPGFAEFVGHPLVDEMRDEGSGIRDQGSGIRDQGSGKREKVLAILPGSRMGEIEKHLPVLLKVVEDLSTPRGEGASGTVKAVIPAANERAYRVIARAIEQSEQSNSRTISLQLGGARDALRKADAAVVASGTATLEAALAGCPTVLVYKVGWLLEAVARVFVRGVRHVGLANIIAEKAGVPCPMPELLQKDFTAEKVLMAVRPLLERKEANDIARALLAETMELLKSDGEAIGRIVACLGI